MLKTEFKTSTSTFANKVGCSVQGKKEGKKKGLGTFSKRFFLSCPLNYQQMALNSLGNQTPDVLTKGPLVIQIHNPSCATKVEKETTLLLLMENNTGGWVNGCEIAKECEKRKKQCMCLVQQQQSIVVFWVTENAFSVLY